MKKYKVCFKEKDNKVKELEVEADDVFDLHDEIHVAGLDHDGRSPVCRRHCPALLHDPLAQAEHHLGGHGAGHALRHDLRPRPRGFRLAPAKAPEAISSCIVRDSRITRILITGQSWITFAA